MGLARGAVIECGVVDANANANGSVLQATIDHGLCFYLASFFLLFLMHR